MVTIAQRIEALRTEKGISRPALAAAVKLPRMSIEKFETGRQTPSQEQQKMLATFFGVSVSYLKGESDDPTSMESWLNGNVPDEPMTSPSPAPRRAAVSAAPVKVKEDGAVFGALLKSPAFQSLIKDAAAEYLKSPEGQALIAKAVRRELDKR